MGQDDGFGNGFSFRMQHEHLLVGRRHSAPRHFEDRSISSVIHAPRGEHSEKPAKFMTSSSVHLVGAGHSSNCPPASMCSAGECLAISLNRPTRITNWRQTDLLFWSS